MLLRINISKRIHNKHMNRRLAFIGSLSLAHVLVLVRRGFTDAREIVIIEGYDRTYEEALWIH